MKVLELREISKSFRGVEALKKVCLSVEEGERRAIIGADGAGKSTLFNIISGIVKPDLGDIIFYGDRVNNLSKQKRSKMGIERTDGKGKLFLNMNLKDNLRLASHRKNSISKQEELLESLGLSDKRGVNIRELSYAERRKAELLVALARSPRLILMDEPAAGMSPEETEAMTSIIKNIPRDITVMLIEHDMELILNTADHITVLHNGQVICDEDKLKIRSCQYISDICPDLQDEGGK